MIFFFLFGVYCFSASVSVSVMVEAKTSLHCVQAHESLGLLGRYMMNGPHYIQARGD